MRDFYEFCKTKKLIAFIIIGLSLLSMVLLFKTAMTKNEVFIMDENSVKGIKAASIGDGVSLLVKATRDDISVEREVIIKPTDETSKPKEKEYSILPEDEINIEITRLLKEINQREINNKDSTLNLPKNIGDTVTLDWKRTENKYSWLLPLIFPPFVLIFLYRGERDEIKQMARMEVDSVINELPSFNNKLVLLLGSGLVYEEALRRIAATEETCSQILPRKLGEIVREAENTNRDATQILNEYARRKKISELKRMTNIIMDNQKKGTDLRSKLTLEGELLWDKRKKRAEEQGKISESKLTIPLGVMLIALLIVTAGPALMQI